MVNTRRTIQEELQRTERQDVPINENIAQDPPLQDPQDQSHHQRMADEGDQVGPSSQPQQPFSSTPQQPIQPDEWRKFFALFEQQSRMFNDQSKILNDLLEERRIQRSSQPQHQANQPTIPAMSQTVAEGLPAQGEKSVPQNNQPPPPEQQANPFNYVPPPPAQVEQAPSRPESQVGGGLHVPWDPGYATGARGATAGRGSGGT